MLPVVFPVIGPTRVRDTYNAPRGGGTRVHQGVDLPMLDRSYTYVVRSAAPGTVEQTWRETSRGRPNQGNAYLIRDDDGWMHLYAHLRYAPTLERGERVSAGQPLGLMGQSGNARDTGPHLHYHVEDDRGRRVNPTARLAELHMALERARVATRASEREPSIVRGHHAMQRAVMGDARGGGIAMLPRELDDGVPDMEAPRRGERRLQTSGPRPQPPARVRAETQEAIEQARMAYRGAAPLVAREVRAVLDQSVWDYLLGALDAAQLEQALLMRQALGPTLEEQLRAAARAAREAERGDAVRWLDAYELLLGVHTLAGSVIGSFDSLRAQARDGGPAVVLMPVLEAASFANAVIEESLRSGEALAAVVREGYDDASEVYESVTSGGGLAMLAVLLLLAFGMMK